MLGFNKNKKKFSLYYLEENEIYTQDMSANCVFLDHNTKEIKKEKGRFHICSRSLIFESDHKETPIYKYYFRYFMARPNQQGYKKIEIELTRIIEIKTTGPPSPYANKENPEGFKIEIYPSSHENFNDVYSWILNLYDISKDNNPGFDPEKDLDMIMRAGSETKKFDMSNISVNERPIIDRAPLQIRRIVPLISISGFLYPTNKAIYFQPKYGQSADPVMKIEIEQISKLYLRRFELMNIGLEIFIQEKNKDTHESLYFAFNNESERDQVYKSLRDRLKSEILNRVTLENSVEQWQRREISNYEYLMRLNDAGNRSFNDLSQYPIFPWVLKDFESQQIDINDPQYYRDLSKPIGALQPQRLQEFRRRYEDMPRPKFMYGTHYSTPGYVIGYLVRREPQYMLKLQSGRFDKPDRLFKSIKGDWSNVMNNNASVKELIPEFYGEDDSFLRNNMSLNLGERQNGKKVDDVKMPKWANNASEFLKINREALESEYVSNNLHLWIDLIFGYKQRGPNSVEADNVFHPLTYEGAVDLEKITDPLERQAQRCQINEFGQCPKQLFKIQHPPRKVMKYQAKQNLQDKFGIVGQNSGLSGSENDELFKTSSDSLQRNGLQQQQSNNEEFKSNNSLGADCLWANQKFQNSVIQKANKQGINNIIELQKDKNKMISVGQDGSVKVIDLGTMSVKRSFKLCSFHLSCICPFNSNDELFAIGGWDSRVYVFNLNYGSTIGVIQEHQDTVSSIIHMKKRNQLFTASWDCIIKKFDIIEGGVDEDAEDFYCHDNSITALASNEGEDILAFGDVEGMVNVYNIDSVEKIFDFKIEGEKIIKIIIQDNNLAAIGDHTIKFFEISGTEISTFVIEKYNGTFNDAIVDGHYIVAVTNKGHMPVYDLLQEKKVKYLFKDYKENQDEMVEDDKQFTTIFVNSESNVSIVGTQNGTMHIIQKE